MPRERKELKRRSNCIEPKKYTSKYKLSEVVAMFKRIINPPNKIKGNEETI